MKKCKLCGRTLKSSHKGVICSDCRHKIGAFAKKSIAGTAVVAGALAAGAALKEKGTESIEETVKKISANEKAAAVRNAGKKIYEEGAEKMNLAGSFIEEHTMGAKDLIDRGIDAVEYKLKGLPAAYAREEHPLFGKIKGMLSDRFDFLEDFEEEELHYIDEEEFDKMFEEEK